MLRGLPQLTLSPGQRLRTGRQRAPYALHSSSLQLLYVTWGPCAVGLVDNGVIRTTSRNFKRSFSRNKKTQLLPHCEKTQHFHPPLLPPPSPPTWRRWRRRTAVATGGDGGGDGRRRRDGRRWLRRRTAATDGGGDGRRRGSGKQGVGRLIHCKGSCTGSFARNTLHGNLHWILHWMLHGMLHGVGGC